MGTRTLIGALAFLLLSSASMPSKADAEDWQLTLNCQQRASRGRVSCELEVDALSRSVSWADLVVVQAPDFARPLRSRVGPNEASHKSERRIRLPIALVATATGRAELVVRGRAVLCESAGTPPKSVCVPAVREARAEVFVGPIER